jgi:protein TonB
LAAACHLLLLLGIGFHTGALPDRPSNDLEVVLVRDPEPNAAPNIRADYLAEADQIGAGSSPDVRHAQMPDGSLPLGGAGQASGGGKHDLGGGEDDLIVARQGHSSEAATQAVARGERSSLIVAPTSTDDMGFDTGDALALRGNPRDEMVVTANTRSSGVALYLDAWRHRIERIGTANYPLDAVRRAALTGNPVVEVRVAADGRLVDAVVVRSSGHIILDQAALNILRLAAPFDPFPPEVAARHDSLRLSYEWEFANGEWRDSTVRGPSNTP